MKTRVDAVKHKNNNDPYYHYRTGASRKRKTQTKANRPVPANAFVETNSQVPTNSEHDESLRRTVAGLQSRIASRQRERLDSRDADTESASTSFTTAVPLPIALPVAGLIALCSSCTSQ